MEEQTIPGDGVDHRMGHHQRAHGLCVFTGFHGFWRIAVGNPCAKDL
jgi:hypothetical protein